MSISRFIVHCEPGEPAKPFLTLDETFNFLKKEGFITALHHNDADTGKLFKQTAEEYCLSEQEQLARPLYITASLSDEGVFVENEAFWIKNYMLDEFYNPERMPFIEAVYQD